MLYCYWLSWRHVCYIGAGCHGDMYVILLLVVMETCMLYCYWLSWRHVCYIVTGCHGDMYVILLLVVMETCMLYCCWLSWRYECYIVPGCHRDVCYIVAGCHRDVCYIVAGCQGDMYVLLVVMEHICYCCWLPWKHVCILLLVVIETYILYLQLEKSQDPDSVDVCEVLMEMRQSRMGLIQTPDQLRFSYSAIIEGCKHVLHPSSVDSGIDDNNLCQVGLETNGVSGRSTYQVINPFWLID